MPDSLWRRGIGGANEAIEWGCRRIGSPVRRGPGARRAIALTFDDGPSPGTLALLEDLASAGVRATFFQCGINVVRHPEIARAVLREGHEIGNHTHSHARLAPRAGWNANLRLPGSVVKEFADAQEVFQRELGYSPTLLRTPHGLPWFGVETAKTKFGMTDILWTAIGHDWEWPAEEVARRLVDGASPGAILCLHDGREIRPSPDIAVTLDATRRIVENLRARGYAFETVSELLRSDDAASQARQAS